ncbi:MAG: chemotaxis protein CheC, partial [Oscillospiraceae bacterium]
MSNDLQNAAPAVPEGVDFSEMQLSAVSEIQNISMGSAATAVSNLLDAKVWITTPRVRIIKYKDVNYTQFDPSIRVTVNYIKGVTGTNAMILKQSDVQLMLNQLMGLPL